MKTMAMILDGVIKNVVVWDGKTTWSPGAQYTLMDITDLSPQPGIGWTHVDDMFIAPIPEQGNEEGQ